MQDPEMWRRRAGAGEGDPPAVGEAQSWELVFSADGRELRWSGQR